jgi:hypothetical protein
MAQFQPFRVFKLVRPTGLLLQAIVQRFAKLDRIVSPKDASKPVVKRSYVKMAVRHRWTPTLAHSPVVTTAYHMAVSILARPMAANGRLGASKSALAHHSIRSTARSCAARNRTIQHPRQSLLPKRRRTCLPQPPQSSMRSLRRYHRSCHLKSSTAILQAHFPALIRPVPAPMCPNQYHITTR